MDTGFIVSCIEFTLVFWIVNAIIGLLELQPIYKILVVLLILILIIIFSGYTGGDLGTLQPLHLRHGVN